MAGCLLDISHNHAQWCDDDTDAANDKHPCDLCEVSACDGKYVAHPSVEDQDGEEDGDCPVYGDDCSHVGVVLSVG